MRSALFRHLVSTTSFVLLALAGAALVMPTARGQAGPQFEGTPDHTVAIPVPMGFVSATTGHLHLEIPIASIPQRGSDPIVTKFIYDTNRFNYALGPCAGNAMWCAMGSGWRLTQDTSHSGFGAYDSTQGTCTDSGYPMGTVTTYSNFRYVETNGTVHAINNSGFYTQYVNCYTTGGTRDPNLGYPTAFTASSSDKLYTFNVTNLTQMQIQSYDGWFIEDDTRAHPAPMDTNGNVSGYFGSAPVTNDQVGYGCPLGTNPPPTSTGHVIC